MASDDGSSVAATQSGPSQKTSWFDKTRRILLVIGIIYAVILLLLCTPFFQRQTLYLNNIRIPLFPKFDLPEKYGLAPNKTLNMMIPTQDGESLGAWFVLSDRYYHKLSASPTRESLAAEHIQVAVRNHPTILFLHGNAATRAFSARVQHYLTFSSRFGANILAIDYRGFGDSTGTPSEQGLIRDARAAWDWLARKGTIAQDVLIVGHSLGTGAGAALTKELGRDGITPKGLVLLSPFSSIREVLETYQLFGLLPLTKPLAMIPWASNLISWVLVHKFDTLKIVPDIDLPVLIAHAENDWDIPDSHSDVLFNAFLDRVLPKVEVPGNALTATKEEYKAMSSSIKKRQAAKEKLVHQVDIPGFGHTESFWDEKRQRNVTLVKTLWGAHDYCGAQEGVQDAIGRLFGFF
ncbi:hypothetical protein AGABI1DRAFT_74272 [Agaricus bisporus var. burnettii JB137-S8]|uniref:AB hydrolase-1 domain-containing protein n=2 Tax=Agaricus bisporus var. burnettii TaxID=192524 RepID=K5X7Y7_AGABU|nr:uncharacterized protein AGABI1DRAFT_74272 [Agaricus bisporus var. burnettii JB137-S8]EKM79328.1 hypothetical protein AGABI1DRAFT_74272 [Agaricus bisporus var. burnettii JB137-S8]KAF7768101.1 hypothetical protein Agabi119p4_7344 [Agaricus bisporus var. burnettii]